MKGARTFFLLAAGLGLLLCLCRPAAAAEPVRRGFDNWLAVIGQDGTGYCRPQGYLFRNRKVPDFQLRVTRSGAGSDCRVTLISAFRFADLGQKITAEVDGNSLRLEDAILLQTKGAVRVYTVTDKTLAARLLRRMRAGKRIRFEYTDTMQQHSSAEFSLMGASGALDAIGCR